MARGSRKRRALSGLLAAVCLALGHDARSEVWDRTREPFYKSPLAEVREAAQGGNPLAQKRLGDLYNEGTGVAADPAAAARWYRLAAEQGLAPAQYNLAILFSQGRGVPRNPVEAVRWYRLAAAQDLAQAQHILAIVHQRGNGVARDPDAAFRLMTRAAEQGLADARYALGKMYAAAAPVPDRESALAWYRKAAEQGHADAQFELAACYENGWGVKADPRRAFAWYEKAAARGSLLGERRAALLLWQGKGTRQNFRAAEERLREVARALPDDAEVQFALGAIYATGGKGVAREPGKAADRYRAAARRGFPYAQHNLGVLYEKGDGVPQNLETAYMWLLLAAGQGLDRSLAGVASMQPRMNPGMIRRAEQRAAAFKPALPPRTRPPLAVRSLRVDPSEVASGSRYAYRVEFVAADPQGKRQVGVEVGFRILQGSRVLFESKPVRVTAQSDALTTLTKRELPCRAQPGRYEFQAIVRNGEIQAEKTVAFAVR